MGFNTAVMFCNDGLTEIRKCSSEFVEGIARNINDGGEVYGLGFTAQVLPTDHADATQLIAVGGNFATKVFTGCGSHHTEEGQVALLRQWAESLGYRISTEGAESA